MTGVYNREIYTRILCRIKRGIGIEISIIGGSGLLGSNLAKVLDYDGFLNINGSKEWINNIFILYKVLNLDYPSNRNYS